jgi:hypothetical protein
LQLIQGHQELGTQNFCKTEHKEHSFNNCKNINNALFTATNTDWREMTNKKCGSYKTKDLKMFLQMSKIQHYIKTGFNFCLSAVVVSFVQDTSEICWL